MQEPEYKINIRRLGLFSWEYEVMKTSTAGWAAIKYGRMPAKRLAIAVAKYRAYLHRRQIQWFKESLTINI